MAESTKERLLEVGSAMLLERGYNHLGIQAVLEATGVPKGSFYHHFKSKEDFALQVVDRYMVEVHQGLDDCLNDGAHPPLRRVRNFFEGTVEKYRTEGNLGCLLGGVGQELSGVSAVFREKIHWCFAEIARRIAACLEEARARGELPPDMDCRHTADLLLDCWEGAALRSRLLRDSSPLHAMLDFYFRAVG
jgi:TetR/AcrR family transcriptional regulator, transcriptional repressor for nem operon